MATAQQETRTRGGRIIPRETPVPGPVSREELQELAVPELGLPVEALAALAGLDPEP
jgi:hypothetical protein